MALHTSPDSWANTVEMLGNCAEAKDWSQKFREEKALFEYKQEDNAPSLISII